MQGTLNDDGDYFYARNAHGDVSLLLKSDGPRKGSYGYLPYGEADPGLTGEQQSSEPPGLPFNPYRFNDRRLDSGSSSTDMGARRYSSALGRFIQQDSYAGAEADLGLGLDPLNMNRYVFAGGNPLSFFDLNGHEVYVFGEKPFPTRAQSRSSRSSGDSQPLGGATQRSSKRSLEHIPIRTNCEESHPYQPETEVCRGSLGQMAQNDLVKQVALGVGSWVPGTSQVLALNDCIHTGDKLSCAGAIPTPGNITRFAKAGAPAFRHFDDAGRHADEAADTAKPAIGFAEGLGETALTPGRLQHGTKNLTKAGILPNWSHTKSPEIIRKAFTPILEHPQATFEHKLGGTRVRGFLGEINGNRVAVFIYKEGPYQGELASSSVPSPNQLEKWGLSP